ncbi:hypothetical protein [Nocardiopsis synnemataformans]|uniref:hypothetical protein n=1 Tax=Nocardiopsis synnemataformans TaxID=61305 RepID=UPI003EBEAC7D
MDIDDPYEYEAIFPTGDDENADWCPAEWVHDTRTAEMFLECKHCEQREPADMDPLEMDYRFADVLTEGGSRVRRFVSAPMRCKMAVCAFGQVLRFMFFTHRECSKAWSRRGSE